MLPTTARRNGLAPMSQAVSAVPKARTLGIDMPIALRFHQRATTLAIANISMIAIWGTGRASRWSATQSSSSILMA